MKFETEHGCVVSETATAYGNSKQIGRYAIAAAMNEVLTRAERVDQMEKLKPRAVQENTVRRFGSRRLSAQPGQQVHLYR